MLGDHRGDLSISFVTPNAVRFFWVAPISHVVGVAARDRLAAPVTLGFFEKGWLVADSRGLWHASRTCAGLGNVRSYAGVHGVAQASAACCI